MDFSRPFPFIIKFIRRKKFSIKSFRIISLNETSRLSTRDIKGINCDVLLISDYPEDEICFLCLFVSGIVKSEKFWFSFKEQWGFLGILLTKEIKTSFKEVIYGI